MINNGQVEHSTGKAAAAGVLRDIQTVGEMRIGWEGKKQERLPVESKTQT